LDSQLTNWIRIPFFTKKLDLIMHLFTI